MNPFSRFTRSQAYYLWRKLCAGNIDRSLLSRLCTLEGETDLWAWFADFFYETLEY